MQVTQFRRTDVAPFTLVPAGAVAVVTAYHVFTRAIVNTWVVITLINV